MTYHPNTDPRSREATPLRRERLFGRMIRLWIEHSRRMVEFGIRPF